MTCKDCIHNEVCYRREVCNDIEERIRKLGCMDFIARADVQEIKHGEWKLCYEDWRMQIAGDECSACGFQHYGTCISHYHYCPHCGAKMDGGTNDDSKKSARASESRICRNAYSVQRSSRKADTKEAD